MRGIRVDTTIFFSYPSRRHLNAYLPSWHRRERSQVPRLLFINPANREKGLGNIKATAWPPLNLPYLAARTPRLYEIDVIDENIEPFQYRDADIVGITGFTPSIYRAYQIAHIYRQKGITTVMGGIHVSMTPEEALSFCDAIVIGEGEDVWPKVLKDFEAGCLQRTYRGTLVDLATLPLPRRDILNNSFYRWASVQTSRGCPMNCSFCSVTAFNGRRFRRRPLDAVVEELKQIPQKLIMIADDNILGYGEEDIQWAHSFFSKILQEGIRKRFFVQSTILLGEDRELIRLAARAGVKIAFIGIESLNPAALRSYHKGINLERASQERYKELIGGIRQGGIAVIGGFMLGSDDDDRDVFSSTLKFIRSSRIDVLQLTKPTPLPGTQLWNDLCEQGRILDQEFPRAWENYRLTKMVFKPARMSVEEVYEGFTHLRKCYYGTLETLKRYVSTFAATKSLSASLIAFKIDSSYRKAFRHSEHYRLYG
jgi:radical SAM superfamily enzyme YgiQ (UPF0313 family)